MQHREDGWEGFTATYVTIQCESQHIVSSGLGG